MPFGSEPQDELLTTKPQKTCCQEVAARRLKDVAHGALYLASDEFSFVAGSELVIDGGYTCQ